jgi:hypothetical protein
VQVVAISTPTIPSWRWRIVTYAGDTLAESQETFPTIVSAVAEGTRRLIAMNVVDHSTRTYGWYRTTGYRAAPRSAAAS